MSLRDIAQSAVASAFGVAPEAIKTVTLRDTPGAGAYDIATNKTAQGAVKIYTFPAAFYQSREQKLADDAAKTATLLINGRDLAASGFTGTITSDDQFIVDGVTWSVDDARPDPVGVTIIAQIRK